MTEQGEKSEAASREERILSWWEEHKIFEKSLQKPSPKGEFIFYEGPPTANGKPGIHHLESRAFKDAVPRYKTMQGFRVGRKAGWDTHGLPVELEVEKELGFSGKPDIEKYGVAAFNKKCRESVLKYIDEWSRFTKRIGYWVDQGSAYFTYDASYMESVWNMVKDIFDDGRLYKDYKVLPWCARCGTALSSHELAQGYEEVKDLSVTAKFELVDEPGTYFLAWTTTPWTLPGNVALAVGKDIEYGVYKKDEEQIIVATKRAEALGLTEPLKTFRGKELLGKKYRSLFDFLPGLTNETERPKLDKAYQVYSADFVTTEDGTGIVHTAVMYGADDFELGNTIGLPKVHTVGADGMFVSGTGFLEGRFVKDEEVAVDIVKDLAGRGLLFNKGKHEHTYPFCWRCKTPLIYYARDSWYIRMSDLRDTLVAENKKVQWEPSHIRDGRMGEWLSGAKEWAVSRERYWGTPLPVWESEDKSERLVVGSVDELAKHTKKSENRYFIMRHGEAENVLAKINSSLLGGIETTHHLTEKGKEDVREASKYLKREGITRIFASPFTRTRETAELVREELGLPASSVLFDARVREVEVGEFEGKSHDSYHTFYETTEQRFFKRPEGGETLTDVRHRVGEFLYEIEHNYEHERILIVSHGDTLWTLGLVEKGAQHVKLEEMPYPSPGELRELSFVPLPHNDDYELDLHRPYIDDVVLVSSSGKELTRIKEVMDVWFDSGAVPFAQDHYPFENKEWVEGKGYPADYIAEAIDQTRGWFYTLLAIGVLRGKGCAYKNVMCLGHLLDKEGKKMSKSKGNVINPWEAMEEWGVDTLRFWMYSVNQAGDSKNFDEKTLKEADRTLSWLSHSAKFYELFKDGSKEAKKQPIDTWMESRVSETVKEVTEAIDRYSLYEATRNIAKLYEDISQWYVRRVRDRVREGDTATLTTLRQTLQTSSLLLAPFSPFLAEEIWQQVRHADDAESVHLASWPTDGGIDSVLIEEMRRVRESASLLLKLRQEAGIVVRQPLKSATIVGALSSELLKLLADEVNVQNIESQSEVTLDTTLTPELIALGDERTFARAVSDARKNEGFSPKDSVEVVRGEGPYEVELSSGMVKFSLQRNAS